MRGGVLAVVLAGVLSGCAPSMTADAACHVLWSICGAF